MRNVLVVADPNFETTTAIEQAKRLSIADDVKLHIVYFYYENLRGMGSKGDALKQSLLIRLNEKAEAQLEQLLEDEIPFSYEIVWEKNLHTWVNSYAEKNKPAMVMKTGHRSETMFYTPTDWHLIRECPASVLIVAEKKWRKQSGILAAIDLQTEQEEKQRLNEKILATAKYLATVFDVPLDVCYTPVVSDILRDFGVQYLDEIEQDARQNLQNKINHLGKTYGIAVENFHVNAGKPEKVIPSLAAKLHVGLVVVGTIGRSGITGKLLGNTAEEILSLLKTNVLTLKP
ncbi:universal stress protein [Thalassotalea litorea]|uniref:universal stress protein n=1 Tax=Thalassotalea litorea TaxID=2020715 RepID=UPI0037358527